MELNRLKKKRTGHRNYTRKIMNDIDECMESFAPERKGKLLALFETMKDKIGILTDLDNEILEKIGEDEIETEIEETSLLQTKMKEKIVSIDLILKANNHSDSGESNPNSSKTVKLPKLEITKFSGNPIEYQSFWDSFKSAVHDNKSITNVDKMNYLKTYLIGAAASTISGLKLTNENYQIAIDMISERFGNKQVLISSHMDSLLKLNKVTSDRDIAKIRVIFDKIESHVRSLNAMGISSEMYGSLLIPVIMEKIPEEFRLIISRRLKSDKWEIKEFIEIFKEELEARENCKFVSAGNYSDTQRNWGKNNQVSTVATLQMSDRIHGNCFFCESPQHRATKCDVVTDVKARKEILKKKGRCFLCLKSKHISRNCTSDMKCYNCSGKHHTSLCETKQKQHVSLRNEQAATSNVNSNVQPCTSSTLHVNSRNSVLLQTATAVVSHPQDSKSVTTRVIFDSGSQRSYISDRLRNALSLPSVQSENLIIKTFGTEHEKVRKCDIVQLSVKGVNSGLNLYLNAYTVPLICSPLGQQSIELARNTHSYLSDIPLADKGSEDSQLEVDLLIGSDYYWQFMTGEIRRGRNNGPVAINTHLGWVLSGPVESKIKTQALCTHVLRTDSIVIQEDCKLTNQLAKFWELESLGVEPEEESICDDFQNKIRMKNGRYEVPLPWKKNHEVVPDNYSASQNRLASLVKRLKESPEILSEYDKVIKDQISKGVIEETKTRKEPGTVHYIPHREVIKLERETTKLRVVYDASSRRGEGPSLNDCLHVGPSLNPLLYDVILRFRVREIAITADIEKAFLNIGIKPDDRDFLRFLWIDDVNKEFPEIKSYRFTRVVFGVNSSPFILNATIRHHLEKYKSSDSDLVDDLLRSLYVDDYISGSGSDETAISQASKVKLCLKEGGFNIRKWQSNSPTLIENMKKNPVFEEDFVQPALEKINESELVKGGDREHSVLGITWDNEQDTLIYDLSKIMEGVSSTSVTKRDVLSISARIFDPIGILSPVTLLFKLMFQELCKKKKNWDNILESDVQNQWDSLVTDMKKAGRISIDRCYVKNLKQAKSVQLHSFGDGSQSAYGAVVYLRAEFEDEVQCCIVSSKTRVAPLSKQTIPRLELLANVMSSKLLKNVVNAFKDLVKIDKVYNWTDSTISLCWIKNEDKQLKQFVENRVKEIRRNAPTEQWKYCPTSENPADIASRGVKATKLKESKLWFHGPDFLLKDSEHWPKQPVLKNTEEVTRELKMSKPVQIVMVNVNKEEKKCDLSVIINVENFSDMSRLIRVTSIVLKFIKKLKGEDSEEDDHEKEAENMWIRTVQQSIEKGDKYKNLKSSLGLFKDREGLLRCIGRIGQSNVPYDMKFPVLLPTDHYFTVLVIRSCHEIVKHNGVSETLVQLRSRFWVIRGRQTVKKILSRCVICKKIEGRPFCLPPDIDLPSFRMSDEFAFAKIGIDFAGPLYVKNIYNQDNCMNKCYIALFTCASTRAIHLDLCPSLSTEAFVRSMKRFVARRGVPQFVLSDNGKTFKGKQLKDYLSYYGIVWKFNVAKAPWWGGFFERLVRSVKRCLKKTVGKSRLTYEELLTIIVEIEGVLNSRPLTYIGDQITEPLTPSHLVIGKRLLSSNRNGNFVGERNHSHADLTKRQRFLQTKLEHFVKRWKNEYLTELRTHHNCHGKRRQPKVNVGDVVNIHEDKTPRQSWKIGVIDSILEGKDGHYRAAVVRTYNGSTVSNITRPLARLYPIEVKMVEPTESTQQAVPGITFVERAEQEAIHEQ